MTQHHEHGGPACRELFAKLSDYLDGEIDAESCSHIDAHLDDCPPCKEFLDSLRKTLRWVQTDPAGGLPDEAKRRVIEAWARARREIDRS